MNNIGKEKDEGNHEYKLTLMNVDKEKKERISTQMRYRVEEGRGEALYTIGVTDEGEIIGLDQEEYEKSEKILKEVCEINNYTLKLISTQKIGTKKMYEFLIREKNNDKYIDVRIACAGNVDAGKCLGEKTKIRMFDGSIKNIEEIKKGDQIMGDDSKIRNVLEITRGEGYLYQINGQYIMNKNHILCLKAANRIMIEKEKNCHISYFIYENGKPKVYNIETNFDKKEAEIFLSKKNLIRENDIIEITLEDYINLDYLTQNSLKLYREEIKYEEKEIKFDPYIYGYFLKNFNIERNELIINQKIKNHLKYFLERYDIKIENDFDRRTKIIYKNNNEIMDFYKKNSSKISDIYKYNNKEVRYELLAGIIDSNIFFEENKTSYSLLLNKNDKELLEDIEEICLSLALNVTIKDCNLYQEIENKKIKTFEYKKIKIFGKNIKNIVLFTNKNEKIPIENSDINHIFEIKIIGKGIYYGFELDGNKKFLLKDNIVSHNSSLLGVLLTGCLDDGRGSSRINVFNYQHEIKSGRTSSISQHILGFNTNGDIINYGDSFGRKKSWTDIVRDSLKVITFYDLCGHEKYLKTTILGLTSQFPDLVFILVGANMGVSNMTKEHIFLCLSLHIPFVIIITKIDICKDRQEVLKNTVKDIKCLLKLPGINKIPFDIKSSDDILSVVKNIHSNSIVPFFYVSNVSGYGLDFIRSFLNFYQKKTNNISDINNNDNKIEFYVDQKFIVNGVGLVIGGQLVSGNIKVGDKLIIGPFNNHFFSFQAKSLHVKKTNVDQANHGSYVCIAIKKPDNFFIRRGQVVLNFSDIPSQCWEFVCDITVLKSHSTTIRIGYQPCLHTLGIRQSAKIISISNKQCSKNNKNNEDNNILRTGDKATVRFRFSYKPEFLKNNTRVILADNRVKIIGKIVSLDKEILSVI